MIPRIGITSSVNKRDYESNDRDVVMLPWNYTKIVDDCGGIPLILPEGVDPDSCITAIDGLIVAGGRDIDPSNYGEAPESLTKDTRVSQDLWEINLIMSAKKQNMPILGICRGHQLMAIVHGGSLIQHLPSTSPFEEHGAWGGEWSDHQVEVIQGSLLSSIIDSPTSVNSAHHQGVSDPGSLIVSAKSADGLIEGMEDEEADFLISVQWHPEALGQKELIEALVEASRKRMSELGIN